MLFPKLSDVLGLDSVTGGSELLLTKIAHLEKKIEAHDIDPSRPSYFKSGLSFLLFNAAYLLPVISVGFASALMASPLVALMATAALNTHAQMGEAFIQTSRKKNQDNRISDRAVLENFLQKTGSQRSVLLSTSIMGCVCLAVTLAAGPLARLLGGFTSGAFSSLSRTPLGSYLSNKMVRSAHKNAVKAMRKPLGKVFSHAAEYGPAYVGAKINASVVFARVATAGLLSKLFYKAKSSKPTPDQDNMNVTVVAENKPKAMYRLKNDMSV